MPPLLEGHFFTSEVVAITTVTIINILSVTKNKYLCKNLG
jgi:hypothetical protein